MNENAARVDWAGVGVRLPARWLGRGRAAGGAAGAAAGAAGAGGVRARSGRATTGRASGGGARGVGGSAGERQRRLGKRGGSDRWGATKVVSMAVCAVEVTLVDERRSTPPYPAAVDAQMLIPPSTAIAAPVMNRLSSLARKRTARGDLLRRRVAAERDHRLEDLRRPGLVLAGRHGLDAVLERRCPPGPGGSSSTRMPRAATSFAAVRISPTSACLDVA